MSVAYSVLVALLSLVFLWILGFALLLPMESKNQAQGSTLFFLAPVVGLASISIVCTFATLAGLPSDLYARAIGVPLLLLALFVLAVQFRDYSVENARKNVWIPPTITFVVAAVMGFLPLILGGWQYVILRGNGTDAFNYVAMADALKGYPIDWILGVSKDRLVEVSPSLSLAQDLLRTRWTTSSVLAFFSSLFNIPPIGFEYAFTVMLFVVTSSSLIAALILVGLRQSLAAILSLAFCFGFWGQLVLDLRAFSHIAALPILIPIIVQLMITTTGTDASIPRILDWRINTLFIGAVIFQYPEIVLAFLPGILILLVLRLNRDGRWRLLDKKTSGYLLRLGISTAFIVTPLLGFLLAFTKSQAKFGLQKTPGWEVAYFSWLRDPTRGMWGLSVSPGLGAILDHGYSAVGFLIAVLLDIVIVLRIVDLVRHKDRSWFSLEAGIVALAGTGVASAACLILVGNPWAAGKLATYFSVLIPIWFAMLLAEGLSTPISSLSPKAKIMSRLTSVVMAAWVISNFIFAAARIVHSKNGTDYSGYINHHGEYRRVNADIFQGPLISTCPQGSTVAVIDPRVWFREFSVHVLEGLGFRVKLPGISAIRSTEAENSLLYKPSRISCVFYGGGKLTTAVQGQVAPSIAPSPSSLAGVTSIQNEYGLEFYVEEQSVYFWDSGRPVELKLFSDIDREINLEFELCPGRNRTEANPINVHFSNIQTSVRITRCTLVTLPLRVSSGISPLNMSVEDSENMPTIIGRDTRDLKLSVKLLGIR
jgi:hypothetical protein